MNRHHPDARTGMAQTAAITAASRAGLGLLRLTRGALGRAIACLLLWQERAAERRHLMMMDDRMLKDIGLTRADVEAEVQKPFWHS